MKKTVNKKEVSSGLIDSPEVDIINRFKTAVEKKIVKQLLSKYIRDFSIESVSDRNTLGEIIYFEVVQKRLQDKVNKMYDEDKAVPINFLELMHKNSDTIIKLKNSLGLGKSKEKKEAYNALEHLKKRHLRWMEENQASRELRCPHCQKMVLLKIRTDIWEAQKHPFFKDQRLYNVALFSSIGKTVNIDNEFISKVLETSPDYVAWMIEKANKYDNQKQESNQDQEQKA